MCFFIFFKTYFDLRKWILPLINNAEKGSRDLFFCHKRILHTHAFLLKGELKPAIWFPTVVFVFSKMQSPLETKLQSEHLQSTASYRYACTAAANGCNTFITVKVALLYAKKMNFSKIIFLASMHLFKVSKRNTGTRCGVCSITPMTSFRCLLMLTLNIYHTLFQYFYWWLWTSNCYITRCRMLF